MSTSIHPRPYRIQIFNQHREVHADRKFRLFLDLRPGLGLRQAKYELDSLLAALAEQDESEPDVMRYYLAVSEIDGSDEFHWMLR